MFSFNKPSLLFHGRFLKRESTRIVEGVAATQILHALFRAPLVIQKNQFNARRHKLEVHKKDRQLFVRPHATLAEVLGKTSHLIKLSLAEQSFKSRFNEPGIFKEKFKN